MKPLQDIKILELSHVIAGPFSGMLLGDLGAQIVKIEQPGKGEYARFAGPTINGTSLWYPSYNRNKKSITVDIKNDQGQEIIRDLVKHVDVVLENYRPGLLNDLGLGFEELQKINPRLIMVSVSGFGQSGPKKMKTAFDMTISAMSGLMAVTGETYGVPMKMGISSTDFLAALYCVIGTLAAIRHRDLTGKGQYVDVSMYSAALSVLETSIPEYKFSGKEPGRPGNRRMHTAPSNVFQAKDGYVYIAAFFDSHWAKLCRLLDCDELLDHPKFITGELRKKNEEEIEALIQVWVENFSLNEVIQLLEDAGIPNAPVNTIERIMNDPHVIENEYLMNFDYGDIGQFTTVGCPIKFSGFDTELFLPPATLGQHNEEIIKDMLEYSQEKYEKLKAQQII